MAFGIFLFSIVNEQTHASCPEALSNVLSAWIRELPPPTTGLQKDIHKLVSSPKLPKRIDTLFSKDIWQRTKVIEISTESVDKLKQGRGWDSQIVYNPNANDFVLRGDVALSDSEILKAHLAHKENSNPFRGDFEIHVPGESKSGMPEIVRLVHELAHAQFEILLQKNIEGIGRRYPNRVRKLYDGSWAIDTAFRTYLTERYAHEIEFLLLRDFYDVFGWRPYPEFAEGAGVPALWRRVSHYILVHPTYRLPRDDLKEFADLQLEEILGYEI